VDRADVLVEHPGQLRDDLHGRENLRFYARPRDLDGD